MDKHKAIKLAGTQEKLAAILGITRQAVQQWPEIPPLQVYRLKELRPQWFKETKR